MVRPVGKKFIIKKQYTNVKSAPLAISNLRIIFITSFADFAHVSTVFTLSGLLLLWQLNIVLRVMFYILVMKAQIDMVRGLFEHIHVSLGCLLEFILGADFDVLFAFGQPSFGRFAVMDAQIVQNQKEFP